MASLSAFLKVGNSKRLPPKPEVGIGRTRRPGHFEAWVIWNNATLPAEVYRITVTAESPDYGRVITPTSFTFGPAHEKPFSKSLEVPLLLKEFLVGVHRAKRATLTFEFHLSENGFPHSLKKRYDLNEILPRYRGKGSPAPNMAPPDSYPQAPDPAELAALPVSALKARSEAIKKEIE